MHFPYTAKSYAKINLALRVLGRREDGMHELSSLMVPVALCDHLRFALSQEFCYQGPPELDGEHNLIYRAWDLLRREYGIQGLTVEHDKRIPMGAGLGGGSSNAATTLIAACHLYGLRPGLSGLSRLAAELGADVPFFIESVPALASGIGERLQPVVLPEFALVLLMPPGSNATALVYRHLGLERGQRTGAVPLQLPAQMRYGDLLELAHNDLEPAARCIQPDLPELRAELERAGADRALMSGSGSSLFGLFATLERANAAVQDLRARLPQVSVEAVAPLPCLPENTDMLDSSQRSC